MQIVGDLHLHSKYSRAVSQSMVLPIMAEWGKKKGIDILSASDWTHPLWFREIKSQLEEDGEGLYKLKSEILASQRSGRNSNSEGDSGVTSLPRMTTNETRFLLSTEIASIYKEKDKLRRIHNLVFAPSIEIAEKINEALRSRGCNLNADGRPIIGITSRNLLELCLEIDKRVILIPCHVWTPHFGVYGSASGYDSIIECFGDLSKYIYGIETGISSDPEMNWRVTELKNRSILSFSDAHSPSNMGREVTAFEIEKPDYENIRQAIMRKGGTKNKVAYTVEFYPEEGKYHYSGHRNCTVSFSPEEVNEKGTTCPVCRREFTEGVAVRIEQLAGADFAKEYEEKVSKSGIKWYTDTTKNHPPYVKLVRLAQIIGGAIGVADKSIKVQVMYEKMTNSLGSELTILLKTPLEEIEKIAGTRTADGVGRVRSGKIKIDAGYDGEYGKVRIWQKEESSSGVLQKSPETQLGLEF